MEKNCKFCSKPFIIAFKEYNRQLKNGRNPDNFYCSMNCAKTNKKRNYDTTEKQFKTSRNNFKKAALKNKKGNFTYYINKSRNRYKNKFKFNNIDEEYLKQLWVEQNQCCAITKIVMVLKISGKKDNYWNTASLDRIDSSKGYVKGNVQFICRPINLMKSNKTDTELVEFLKSIKLD